MSEKKDYYSEAYFKSEFEPNLPAEEDGLKQWGKTEVVGKDLTRVDAYERVTGTAKYTYDINLPGMLACAILRSPHANAKVKKVDISKALKMPGVRAIIKDGDPGTDVPWYGGRNPQSKLFDPHCRFEGEEIAAVAADNIYQARDALKAIEVEYEVLPFIHDEKSAARKDAPQLHDKAGPPRRPMDYSRGDVVKGFKEADVILEHEFSSPVSIHNPMETHGSVASWDGDKLTVWDSSQGVFTQLFDMARLLKIPYNKVRIICNYMGGGFGSKLYTGKYTLIAALLARKTARPVKCMLSREENMLCVGNRPGSRTKVKVGAKKDGTITAFEMDATTSSGAYSGGESFIYMMGELYKCANVKGHMGHYYLNAGPGRAFRAPGFPQSAWAVEQLMDMLAEKLKMDPVALRLKNLPENSQMNGNIPYSSIGLKETLEEGAKEFGWHKRKDIKKDGHIKRGMGVASGVWSWGCGAPPANVTLKMFVDGSVLVTTGAMDIGTGTKTIGCQVAAEELALPIEKIDIDNGDTRDNPYAAASGGSMTLPTIAPAVRHAASRLKKTLINWGAEELKLPVEELTLAEGHVVSTKDNSIKVPYARLIQKKGLMDVVESGSRAPNPEGQRIQPFVTHFAEVEVNTLTGKVKVLRLLGAQDSGRRMNKATYNNQVHGGMIQGLGFALTEGRVLDRQTGKMANCSFLDYKIPTAMEATWQHDVVAVEKADESNNTGAKGLGEPAKIPACAAIANAVYNAIGARVPDAVITPDKVLTALNKGGAK